MITPELIGYIRAEFAKGKTRQEIHAGLIADGGWSEADLSEAFRIVIPMQGFGESFSNQKVKLSPSFWQNLVFIIVGLICIVFWYFYHPQIVSFWNSGVKSSQELSINSWDSLVNNFKKLSINFGKIFRADKAQNNIVIPPNNPIIKPIINTVKDCGTTNSPSLNNANTYQNDVVLNCLGNSALYCEDAKAVLNDVLFPTIFQIIKDNNTGQSCNFKLSYRQDNTLIDAIGKKLAGQYLTCPISIVKSLDETKQVPVFSVPDTNNLSKYASQIYFYGTLGLFIENNIEKNKIQALGCSGPYIDSVVASYQKIQSKN